MGGSVSLPRTRVGNHDADALSPDSFGGEFRLMLFVILHHLVGEMVVTGFTFLISMAATMIFSSRAS